MKNKRSFASHRLLKQWLTAQLHLLFYCGATQAIVDAGSHSADMSVRIDGIATLGQIEINVADGEDKGEEEEEEPSVIT